MTSTRKGFRVPAQNSKKEAMSDMKTELANLQMAGRISQMLVQQLMQSVKSMSDDLGSTLNQLYELQYKYNALVKHMNVDVNALNELANKQRLVDFEDAATKQDAKDNLVVADVVEADSTVVITSTAQDDKGVDCGLFRSRLKLSESGVPDLMKSLEGKKVGDKVVTKLNGVDHTIELLAIRNPVAVQEAQSDVVQ